MKNIFSYGAIALLSAGITLGAYKMFLEPKNFVEYAENGNGFVKTAFNNNPLIAAENSDFSNAAEATVDAVVHVKNTAVQTYVDPFEQFFYGTNKGREYTQVGTGSGVIISPDGYIITNYHVVANATEISITLNNKKEYKAKLIGSDEAIDIALVKIEATDLPFITFADSDQVKLGEWVLAVGNPYNLTSTVTAGIVSAKGRDLGNNGRIESYIQTDAAVNPGNSGGALVNTRGELIGINTAISSQTGSYVGYSFAVPSNIAKKVVEDLVEFGNTQRAYLGIRFVELNAENAKELHTDITEGIYINKIIEKGAASESNLKINDIIVQINNVKIKKLADLNGQMNAHRPGDQIQVTVLRNGTEQVIPVVLKNEFGKETYGATEFIDNVLGMELSELSSQQKKLYNITYGVSIVKLNNDSFKKYGINEGAVILAVERQKVSKVDDVEQYLRMYKDNPYVTLQILNTDNRVEYISISL
ncbi:MAG: Do family serine endopeptidase [Flavobacteriaceae bacterium]|nr:Do family serine endopeptidase [Flavobacteriaceae bacterium]